MPALKKIALQESANVNVDEDDENHFIHLVTLHTGPGNQSTKGEEDQEEETQEEETEESSEEDSNK